MVNEDQLMSRISDAPWASYKATVALGGAGGLGSWVAFFLSRIGHSLMVYDMDTVGIENIGGGQFYSSNQAGLMKTAALRQNLFNFTGQNSYTGLGRYEEGMTVMPITITTFDNMEARKDMFETWVELVKNREKDDERIYCFINISMLPEGGFIEVVNKPSRVERWRNDWVPSSDIADIPCSFKSTTHNASLMAGKAVGILNNVIFNKIHGMDLRDVPYRTVEDLQLIMTETYV